MNDMTGNFRPDPPFPEGPRIYIVAATGRDSRCSLEVTPPPGETHFVSFRVSMSPEKVLTVHEMIVTKE